jgi:hypothetical protein
MRSFLPFTILLVLGLPTAATCADGADGAEDASQLAASPYDIGNNGVTPTPEMWFYLQETRRYDDPQMAIRRNAEQRASERRSRLASRKWFGLSNQRPIANPTPTMGVYSPMWVASLWDPYRWAGVGYPAMLLLADGIWTGSGR